MLFLSTLVVSAAILLVPATISVFTVRGDRGSVPRIEHALLAAVLVALAAVAAGALTGAGPSAATLSALLLGLSVLAWWPAGRDWDARGLVAWAITLDAGVAYLVYVMVWMTQAGLSPVSLVASSLLWVLELFVLVIGVGYLWEFVDVLSRRVWTAHVDTRTLPPERKAHRPFVSLHVPTHNEPPDLVIETLQHLLRQQYDDYEVVVIDNNTTDEGLWHPVRDFCAEHERLVFLHVEDWPGFKSGALNYALTRTDPRAELIGIVDADYHVAPDFLNECAPLFADPEISFVQTPQDYRGWEQAPYFRRLYFQYAYFFDVSQRSRNERNGAIFGGTMGLIRREDLAAVGGWDEWCITEDAELSLRLLRQGGRGVHVDEAFGRGVMPLTFETLKRQRFRWCFGGVQILRRHWRSLLPGRKTAENRLSLGQRWAYLVGGLQWFGDLAAVTLSGFLLVGALDASLGQGLVLRRLAGVVMVALSVFVVLGFLRALALIRRTSGASTKEALGAFGLWAALSLTVARASARALVAKEGAFLRTPKVRGRLSWRDAVRGNADELVLGSACLVAVVVTLAQGRGRLVMLAGLLLVQAVSHLAAPANSWAAINSDLSPELRRRRATGRSSWERVRPAGRRGGVVLAGIVALLGAFVVFASPLGVPDLPSTPADASDQSPVERGQDAPTGDASSTKTGAGESVTPAAEHVSTSAPAASSAILPSQAAQPPPTTQPTQSPQATAGQPTQAQPTQATQPAQPTQATQPTRKPTSKPSQATQPAKPTTAPTPRSTNRP